MKKNFATILFLLFTLSAFSQNKTNDKNHYLQKSKNQKTGFYVFATTGSVLIITGLIYGSAHNDPNSNNYNYTGGFLAAGGLAALGISIPFFSASMKNKRKAMSLSFKNEKMQQLNKNSFVYKSVPSLTLKINF
jgi:hypothetical protein